METRKFACGHSGEVPAYAGRGAARRVRRLEKHFAGCCPACEREMLRRLARKLSVILPTCSNDGKRETRPYTPEEIEALIERNAQK